MMKKALALAALTLIAGQTFAQTTDTADLTTSLTLLGSCAVDGTVITPGVGLADKTQEFGQRTQTAGALGDLATLFGSGPAAATYSVLCGAGQSYSLTFDNGANFDATSSSRQLLRQSIAGTPTAADKIAYSLAFTGTDATPSATPPGFSGAFAAGDSAKEGSVKASLGANQSSYAKNTGTYQDVVVATFTYTP